MDYKEFSRTKQFVADDEGTDSIIAGSATGVTDHVRVAFDKSGELGGIKPCIYACQHGEAACGWHCEFAFLAEALAISLICSEHLIEDIAHFTPPGMISFGRVLALQSKHVCCTVNEAEGKGSDGDLANCPYCKRPHALLAEFSQIGS